MSDFMTDQDKLRAKELGCKVFIKPFRLDEIYRWLDEVEATLVRIGN